MWIARRWVGVYMNCYSSEPQQQKASIVSLYSMRLRVRRHLLVGGPQGGPGLIIMVGPGSPGRAAPPDRGTFFPGTFFRLILLRTFLPTRSTMHGRFFRGSRTFFSGDVFSGSRPTRRRSSNLCHVLLHSQFTVQLHAPQDHVPIPPVWWCRCPPSNCSRLDRASQGSVELSSAKPDQCSLRRIKL
jgi:hypothetical protein